MILLEGPNSRRQHIHDYPDRLARIEIKAEQQMEGQSV
jgi:hypothetical protein